MEDFDEAYRECFPEIYRFLLALCRDPSLAEELTQETFFKALKAIDSFSGNCSLTTWLCQIAKNEYFSYRRKNHIQTDELPLELPSGEDIEQRFTNRETALAVHEALHRLREPYKEVLSLRTFAELPFAQIGLLFGKTESWARVTYYRAKVQIKEELQ